MDRKDIKKTIDDAVDRGIVSGISAAFITNNTVDYHIVGMMGAITPFNERALQMGMYYDLASCTKVICTTTRIFELIGQGKLGLEDRVSSILHDFRYPTVTVADLLLHQSGLPADLKDKSSLTKENIIDCIYATELVEEPSVATTYSDIGFILLGLIIEKIDGKDLATTYKEHVLKPLGMNESDYHIKDKENCIPTEITADRGLIWGEVHDRKGHLLKEHCGSAGLFSTIEDVAKFVRCFMFKKDVPIKDNFKKLILGTNIKGRSYGWDKKYGEDTLYHTGFTGTSILMDYGKEEGVVILTNRVHPSRNNQAFLDWRNELNEKILERQ